MQQASTSALRREQTRCASLGMGRSRPLIRPARSKKDAAPVDSLVHAEPTPRRARRSSARLAASSAWSRSAMMSSICSMPMLSRIVSGLHAGLLLLLVRHLPMRGGGGMAGQRFGVADIDEPLDQLQRVVEPLAGLEAALTPKVRSEQARPPRYFRASAVIGAVGEAGIIDPLDARVVAQEFGHPPGILDMALDPQGDRLDALQQQEGAERRQHRAHRALIDAAAAPDIGGRRRNARHRPGRDRTGRAR